MNYTEATQWEAVGAHVRLVTCRKCGAAILLDPRDSDDPLVLHSRWHEEDLRIKQEWGERA